MRPCCTPQATFFVAYGWVVLLWLLSEYLNRARWARRSAERLNCSWLAIPQHLQLRGSYI